MPATTANLGPGFDSFGFALDVWNRVIVERADKYSMVIEGEGADRLDSSEDNMLPRMAKRAMEKLSVEAPPLRFTCQNAVPPTRGMGSSSTALVAGLAAGLAFAGKDMSTPATKKLLLQMAAEEEGHADNVAPAIYGGFQIAFNTGGQWITQRVDLPSGMQCVLYIPDDEMPTTAARACLPEALTYKDAVFNISRAAMLVNCFATGQYASVRPCVHTTALHTNTSHLRAPSLSASGSTRCAKPWKTGCTSRTASTCSRMMRSSRPPWRPAHTGHFSPALDRQSWRLPAEWASPTWAPTRCRNSSPSRHAHPN